MEIENRVIITISHPKSETYYLSQSQVILTILNL